MTVRLSKEEQTRPNRREKLILFWRLHPIQAAKDIFNVDLIWWQRIALLALWHCSAIFLFLGRGCGKTWILALFCCLRAILYPEEGIGYYTPTSKQWDQFWEYVQQFYDRCPLFADCVELSRSKNAIRMGKTFKMKFTNGSFIESLALTEKARGRRNTIAVFDEYKDHDPNMVNTVALPYLMVEKSTKRINKQIYATTGFYTWNHAYAKYVLYKYKMSLKDPEYAILEYDHRDIDLVENSPYRMSKMVREHIKNEPSMTEEKYLMEMHCKIASESDAIFTYRLLESPRVTPKEDPVNILTESVIDGRNPDEPIAISLARGCRRRTYVMGIDNARVVNGDNFAIQVFEVDEKHRLFKLVHSYADNGLEMPNQAMKIFELCKKFNIVRIFIDNDSYGRALKDLLRYGSPVYNVEPLLDMEDKLHQKLDGRHIIKMFNFTVDNISEMFDKLKSSFQNGRLKLPLDMKRSEGNTEEFNASIEIQRTKRELTQLVIEERGNKFVYVAPGGKKRDRAMALALCNMAALDYCLIAEVYRPKKITAVGVWA